MFFRPVLEKNVLKSKHKIYEIETVIQDFDTYIMLSEKNEVTIFQSLSDIKVVLALLNHGHNPSDAHLNFIPNANV